SICLSACSTSWSLLSSKVSTVSMAQSSGRRADDRDSEGTDRGEATGALHPGSRAPSRHGPPAARSSWPPSVRISRIGSYMKLATCALLAVLAATSAAAQTNLGRQASEPGLPFAMTKVATFNLPWRLAFLPDGRMVITEKPGRIWLVTQAGAKTP